MSARHLVRLVLLGTSLLTGFAVAAQPAANGLSAALAATLQNHPALRTKAAEVEAKGYGVDAVRAQRYPSLSGQLRQMSGATTSVDAAGSTLRLRQPIWAFGRIDDAINSAQTDLIVEQTDQLRLQRQYIENSATAYARTWAAHRRLALSETNVGVHEELHAQIRRREVGQLASLSDVRLAGARLAQAIAQRERHASELRVALDDLRALTLTEIEASQPVDVSLLPVRRLSELEYLVQYYAADAQLKERAIERARAQVEQVRTSSMPTVYAQAEKPLGATSNMSSVTRYGIVLEASLDGAGFALRGRIAESLARVRAAEDELLTIRNELLRSLRSSWNARESAAVLRRNQVESLADLAALLESYQRQYAAGTKQWMDVLNIQRELAEQQQLAIQTESDWLVQSLRIAALTADLDEMAGLARENKN